MQKCILPSVLAMAALLPACSCPSSIREVPAPGGVTTVAQVDALTRCQVKAYGTTLLGRADNPQIVRALQARGASPNGKVLIAGQEYSGGAMLLVTNPAVVGELVAAGCNPSVQGGPDNIVPLTHAIRTGRRELAVCLISAGADPNQVDAKGETPLYLAASRLDAPMCELLLRRGARVNAGRYADGTTPLMAVLKAGGPTATKTAIAELLLSAGADHLLADSNGDMPMHVAPLELMPTLISAGASVNCTNAKGRTPLFFGGSRQRIDFLLHYGADANVRDTDGNTAFDVVADPALKSYLLSKGVRSGHAL